MHLFGCTSSETAEILHWYGGLSQTLSHICWRSPQGYRRQNQKCTMGEMFVNLALTNLLLFLCFFHSECYFCRIESIVELGCIWWSPMLYCSFCYSRCTSDTFGNFTLWISLLLNPEFRLRPEISQKVKSVFRLDSVIHWAFHWDQTSDWAIAE